MRRPRRPFLLAASTLSLLLALAAITLWIRSHFVIDAYGWTTPTGSRSIGSNAGGLNLVSWTNPPDGSWSVTPFTGYRTNRIKGTVTGIPPTWSFAGFRYTYRSFSGLIHRSIRIPFYFLLILSLPLPLLYLYKRSAVRTT